MQISTLRPGLLVSLHTALHGNVAYKTREIEADHVTDDGSRRAEWQTQRIIESPREHEEAVKVRSKARSLITAVCSPSSFGLLCPESDREKLTAAIAEAREAIDDFNMRAQITQASFSILIGRIAADDVEAVRAINGEIRELMTAMESGLRGLDVEAVREAANKAKALSSMLSPEASERAEKAIAVARSAARRIVKAGEAAAIEIDEATLRTIRQSRAAFLDLEDGAEVQEPTLAGRAVDFEMMEAPPPAAPAVPVPSFEL
jgi:hypothetical protein